MNYGHIQGRRIIGARYLVSGHNATLLLLEDEDGRKLVAKQAEGDAGSLDIEAAMLIYLREHSALPVPEIFRAEPDLLVMEHIPQRGGMTLLAEEEAAEHLAALHSVRGHFYGFEHDTLIGSLRQPNTPSDKWIPFFAEHRLLYMAEEACREGRLDTPTTKRIEQLAGKIGTWLSEPEYPALIHGDMWQGNVLVNDGKISGFIDPAIYYADPEIELAFSTLFGTFSEPFFRRYQELRPLSDDFFDIRCELYNLYPLLVHVRLYGGGYVQSVAQTLRKYLG